MPRQDINTPQAPQPQGPYSQAVRAGDFLFISGQLPLDPETGTLVRAGVRAQTRRVLENVRAIVAAAGGTMESIVKVTLYVKNLEDFTQVNEIYGEFFPGLKPARMAVECSRIPKDAAVAADATAWLGA